MMSMNVDPLGRLLATEILVEVVLEEPLDPMNTCRVATNEDDLILFDIGILEELDFDTGGLLAGECKFGLFDLAFEFSEKTSSKCNFKSMVIDIFVDIVRVESVQ